MCIQTIVYGNFWCNKLLDTETKTWVIRQKFLVRTEGGRVGRRRHPKLNKHEV